MTEHDSDAPGVSRRAVLRSGAVAAGGAALLPGVAAAHECPRTPGYWAHHEWPSTIPDPFEVGGVTMSIADWQSFLVSPTHGDKAVIMAQHLVATILNFQFRGALPEGDPGCVDEPLPAFGGRTIREIRLAAEQWLDASSFDDPGTRQDSWIAGGVDGEPLKNALDAFNNDQLGLDCDCDGENDDGDGNDGNGDRNDGNGSTDGGKASDGETSDGGTEPSGGPDGDRTDGSDSGPPDSAGDGPSDSTGGGPPDSAGDSLDGAGGGPPDSAGGGPPDSASGPSSSSRGPPRPSRDARWW